jgi:hypothetical protein
MRTFLAIMALSLVLCSCDKSVFTETATIPVHVTATVVRTKVATNVYQWTAKVGLDRYIDDSVYVTMRWDDYVGDVLNATYTSTITLPPHLTTVFLSNTGYPSAGTAKNIHVLLATSNNPVYLFIYQ